MKKIIKKLKRKITHFFAKRFKFFEKHLGLHVIPANYNSPIPLTFELGPDVFEKEYDCTGIDFNLEDQLHYLTEVFPGYREEYTPEPNPGLSLFDAYVLYSMTREKKPAIMIEVGAGESTGISLAALEANRKQGSPCKFYSIDPYPNEYLKKLKAENFEMIVKKVQDVDIDFLKTADLLFLDSSHMCKINSDVNCEILELIPTLKVGSIVHWHDILIPNNYWKEWVQGANLSWNESYMVHAFMLFNDSFKIIWAAHYMQANHPDKISGEFPFFNNKKHKLSSFWIKRVK